MFVTKKQLKALEDKIFSPKKEKEDKSNVGLLYYAISSTMWENWEPSPLEARLEEANKTISELRRDINLILKEMKKEVVHNNEQWTLEKPKPPVKEQSHCCNNDD